MDTDLESWLRANIGFDDNWSIDCVTFSIHPMKMDVCIHYLGRPTCPICGKTCPRYDTRSRAWRDLDYGSSVCNVKAEFPRIDCPEHGIHEIDIPWAGRTSKLTFRFERRCLNHSMSMPIHLAAKLLNVNDMTIWNIVRKYADEGMRDLNLSEVRNVCIDETSYEKGHRYLTTFIDPDTGGIIFATLGRDNSTLTEFRLWLMYHGGDRKNIANICCDMSPAFIKGIRDEFPDARIVFDKFHVIKMSNDTLDAVRKTSGLKGKKGKGLRFCFMKNRENLDEATVRRIDDVLDEYHHLGKAYSIKEALRDFYAIGDIETAKVVLYGIIDRCLDSTNDDIFELGLTLDRHMQGILAWYDVRMNNGISEGNNSVIQAIKRSARGFAEPENMISLIYVRNFRKNGISY